MKLNRISLNTIGLNRIGLNRIGSPSRGSSSGSARPYIAPEVLASLVAVVKCDGKSNNDPDRAIIKNLVDPDNPFVISNAAYKLNSGFGKYEEDFTQSPPWYAYRGVDVTPYRISLNSNFRPSDAWIIYKTINNPLNDFKVRVSGIPNGGVLYFYITGISNKNIKLVNGDNDIKFDMPTTLGSSGFRIESPNLDWSKLVIEQIPSFQGALVTDGVDDLIVSQKTVQEMLGGSNEITVVSMIHQIEYYSPANTRNNFLCNIKNGIFTDNIINNIGKTGIYGYTYNGTSTNVINNILGDKNDYTSQKSTDFNIKSLYSVEGYITNTGSVAEVSQVAWYWTFIANRVLTTDEINQVIAYYNLDKYVKPDIYYDVKKQGLSNDTPDADWYLKDFSGNGRDMQLYNFAKKLGSGVGKYQEDFTDWNKYPNVETDGSNIWVNSKFNSDWLLYKKSNVAGIKPMKIRVSNIPQNGTLRYIYVKNSTDIAQTYLRITKDGIYELPESVLAEGLLSVGFNLVSQFDDWTNIRIEQIPDYEGALVFDAVEDYGQFVGDLGLKDYTVAVDRAYVKAKGSQVPIISNVVDGSVNTPFLMEHLGIEKILAPHSFGRYTALSELNINRFISYQSTYKYNGSDIIKGTSTDAGSGLTIGRYGGSSSQYANIALWSLLLFPYTLSEFLLERQLKRYKLGTLYPDMVEFRPIVKSNVEYELISFATSTSLVDKIVAGDYMKLGTLYIYIKPKSDNDRVIDVKINGIPTKLEGLQSNGQFRLKGEVTKSPQKINITIDEYIRYEDIVQPYPFIIPIIDTDGKEYTYGDKIKVGTEIRGGINGNNLLPELYKLNGFFNFNGAYFSASNKHVIGKTNVFELTNAPTYLKANEPNCIADPQRLRIPNSSYKILGYIPDISGHGNHLKINNSAYAGMSGANGYTVDWSGWTKNNEVIITDSKITFPKGFNKVVWFCYTYSDVPAYKINVQGLPDSAHITYGGIKIHNGINELIGREGTTNAFGFIINQAADLSNLVIEQIGEYEGSFCLDGVEDYLTIPTLSHGAKQVLMKVNPFTDKCPIYEQRSKVLYKFCVYLNGPTIAYRDGNNASTNTYIDGVLNSHILSNELIGITHNIVMTDNEVDDRTISPLIGRLFPSNSTYAQMSLFTFMSFDDISSEEEIKELNDIVGIEGGYVESPNYYWDAYGKSNMAALDIDYQDLFQSGNANKMLIDKSKAGLAALELYHNSGNNSELINRRLVANNFAYNEESGYNGWLGIGNLTNSFNESYVTSSWKRGGTFIKNRSANGSAIGYTLANWYDATNHILKFKIKITGLADNDTLYIRQYNVTPITSQQLFNGINDVTLDLSASPNPTYRYISFNYSLLTNDVDFEFLYEYQNGLLSDGVDDELKNEHMPVLTDYTWIMKRKRLNDKGSTTLCHKGNGSNSNAFLFEIIEGTTKTRSFGTDSTVVFPDLISWQTKNSYNGQTIASGTSVDGNVLLIFMGSNVYPYYTKAVFYKAMLYDKTIDQLSINMSKNLFEKDELIDVNNPIFKQNN